MVACANALKAGLGRDVQMHHRLLPSAKLRRIATAVDRQQTWTPQTDACAHACMTRSLEDDGAGQIALFLQVVTRTHTAMVMPLLIQMLLMAVNVSAPMVGLEISVKSHPLNPSQRIKTPSNVANHTTSNWRRNLDHGELHTGDQNSESNQEWRSSSPHVDPRNTTTP